MILKLLPEKFRRRSLTLLGHTGAARARARTKPIVAPPAPAPNTDEQRRQAEIEQDMRLARDIQQGLLLEAVPRLPGWEISAMSIPARDLGGDLYDFLPFANGWHGIMIGDVSGKGLPAALRMAVTRTVFRHQARRDEAPGSTLADTNRGVLSEIPQGMVTMLYAKLDTQGGLLKIANAGHNYPIFINGQVSELELSGLPLGVDDESEYEETSAVIHPGDTVVLYTDGVVEAASGPDEEIYGYDRLEQMLRANAHLKPRALLGALLHELRTWSGSEQADDITMVIIRRRLAQLSAELRSISDDILGSERGKQLWEALELPDDAPKSVWFENVPRIVSTAQSLFGRGLARELNGQLRLALEEYR